MGMTCSLQLVGFCRVMMLLVCVQAEVSLTGLSKHKGVAGCVHQYCYRLLCVQVNDDQCPLSKQTSCRRICNQLDITILTLPLTAASRW
jgi:hypothetical protein